MSVYKQSIPSVDLNLFINGNPEEKKQFVQQLGNAFENIGFVAVKGHLLTEDLTGKLYESAKKIFPIACRNKIEI